MKTKELDLKSFPFPKVSGLDAAFPTFKTVPELLKEAKRRGYYNGSKSGNEMFSKLFFRGGQVKFKEGISVDFKESAWRYLRSFMGSWEPKHEEKDAICSMLLDELVDSVEPGNEP